MNEPLFSLKDEKEFKKLYAIQFLASYTAMRYDDACSHGRHESLENPPVQDAEHLAQCAWNHWVDIMGLSEGISDKEVDTKNDKIIGKQG